MQEKGSVRIDLLMGQFQDKSVGFNPLKRKQHEHFVLTETVGVYRLGPTDGPHPLLTSAYVFNTMIKAVLKGACHEIFDLQFFS